MQKTLGSHHVGSFSWGLDKNDIYTLLYEHMWQYIGNEYDYTYVYRRLYHNDYQHH